MNSFVFPLPPRFLRNRRGRSGNALLLLLFFVLLISGLVIGLMLQTRHGRILSGIYANSVQTRILSDSVADLVMGEIRDATADTQINSSGTSTTVAWASQPGAIRTFDTTGNMVNAYKLYSSDQMVVTTGAALKGDVPLTASTWQNNPAIYVNLNQPVVRDIVSSGTSTQQLYYPIADPTLLSNNGGNIPGYKVVAGTNPNGSYTASDYTSSLPMPVKWLYVLADGTRSAMGDGTGTVTLGTIPGASASNPVIGRIAFWTDDETAKINLNTAGEGFYWTPPHAYSYAAGTAPQSGTSYPDPNTDYISTASLNQTSDAFRAASLNALGYDFSYAYLQPADREFNRYPGHPAQTCLSVAFPNATLQQLLGVPGVTSDWFAPIYGNGGTTFGTVGTYVNNNGTVGGNSFSTFSNVNLHADRLYATVDDAAMQATISSGSRPVNFGLASGNDIREREFLLTTRSRAPEVNMFNRPRVCMWPVDGNPTNTVTGVNIGGVTGNNGTFATRTAFDNLIAFCSTIINRNYVGNSNYTWPFIYYRYITPTTGNSSGNTGGASGTVNEMTQYPTNQALFTYLHNLTGQNIPGFSGNFQSKYSTDCDQILTEMLDYIRCTNICDLSLEGGLTSSELQTATPGPEYTPGIRLNDSGHNGWPGHGQVAPLAISSGGNTYYGLGRCLTVSEVALHVTKTSSGAQPYQATLAIELSSPMQGYPGLTPWITAVITGADGFQAAAPVGHTWQNLFPNKITLTVDGPSYQNSNPWMGVDGGGYQGPGLLYGAHVPPGLGLWSASNTGITTGTTLLSSTPFNTTSPMQFKGPSAMTIQLYYGDTGSSSTTGNPFPGEASAPYQTVTLKAFPTITTASSIMAPTNTVTLLNSGSTTLSRYIAALAGSPPFFMANDVVPYSETPIDGDFRLTAAQNSVPASAFQVNPAGTHYLTSASTPYFSTKDLKIYTNDYANGGRVPGAYESTVSYAATATPKGPPCTAPSGQPNNTMTVQNSSVTHDWSTGLAALPDGPWANFPDAGMTYQSVIPSTSSPYPFYFNLPDLDRGTGAYLYDPYREVPSPGMFGSLPTQVLAGKPWQTLLFRPQMNHPSNNSGPPDHLFMDLFWMPVVEPYAISDPFSTAGKINLNTEIVPFTYLQRETGIYAVMKAEKLPLIPTSEGGGSGGAGYKTGTNQSYYYDIDIPTTLKQFDDKFTSNDIFHSASQICEIYLAPSNPLNSLGQPGLPQQTIKSTDWYPPATADSTWYTKFALTGDNLRERPYTDLYPRLTTKSNTYRIHYWVQTLKKSPGTAATTFVDASTPNVTGVTDSVTGQMRGSFLIERYIDYDDSRFGVSINPMTSTLTAAYKYRILESKQFNP